MRRLSAAIVVALLAVGLFAPASFAATPSTSFATKAVPKVVFVVGPAGAATNGYRAQARAAAALARNTPPMSSSSTRRRDVAGRQGRAPGSVAGGLHGPRQRLAEQVPRCALPADPERVRPEPEGGHRRLHRTSTSAKASSVRRSSSPRTRSSCSTTCATPAATPSPDCRRARSPRPAAGRQLRRGLHPGRARPRSSPRHSQSPSYFVKTILAADARSRAPGQGARARTATGSRSRASEAPATSPRWTPRPRRPGSRARWS